MFVLEENDEDNGVDDKNNNNIDCMTGLKWKLVKGRGVLGDFEGKLIVYGLGWVEEWVLRSVWVTNLKIYYFNPVG